MQKPIESINLKTNYSNLTTNESNEVTFNKEDVAIKYKEEKLI
jgi:hypothetical protein